MLFVLDSFYQLRFMTREWVCGAPPVLPAPLWKLLGYHLEAPEDAHTGV